MPEIPRIIVPRPVIDGLPRPIFEPPVTRGIKPPSIRVPDTTIDYPEIDVPTRQEWEGQIQPPKDESQTVPEQDTRDLPPGARPPASQPPAAPPAPSTRTAEIELPGFTIPVPDREVIEATAAVAAVSTASALAATTALKPLFEWLLKLMKTAMKQVVEKVKKKLQKNKYKENGESDDDNPGDKA